MGLDGPAMQTFTVRSKQGPVLTITAPAGTTKKDVALILSHRSELRESNRRILMERLQIELGPGGWTWRSRLLLSDRTFRGEDEAKANYETWLNIYEGGLVK